jgi:hypothetical protein
MKIKTSILEHKSFLFKGAASAFIKISFLFILSFFLSGWIIAQTKSDQPERQQNPRINRLKPGEKILIGIISPELEELWLSGQKKEIPIEMREEKPLSEEEIAEARKRLAELEREKNILTGDFYGLNQFGHRYALIFDRLGYIRYRLTKINEEIAELRKKIKNKQ